MAMPARQASPVIRVVARTTTVMAAAARACRRVPAAGSTRCAVARERESAPRTGAAIRHRGHRRPAAHGGAEPVLLRYRTGRRPAIPFLLIDEHCTDA